MSTAYAVLRRDGSIVSFPALDGAAGSTGFRALAVYESRRTANHFRLIGDDESVRKVLISIPRETKRKKPWKQSTSKSS